MYYYPKGYVHFVWKPFIKPNIAPKRSRLRQKQKEELGRVKDKMEFEL